MSQALISIGEPLLCFLSRNLPLHRRSLLDRLPAFLYLIMCESSVGQALLHSKSVLCLRKHVAHAARYVGVFLFGLPKDKNRNHGPFQTSPLPHADPTPANGSQTLMTMRNEEHLGVLHLDVHRLEPSPPEDGVETATTAS